MKIDILLQLHFYIWILQIDIYFWESEAGSSLSFDRLLIQIIVNFKTIHGV